MSRKPQQQTTPNDKDHFRNRSSKESSHLEPKGPRSGLKSFLQQESQNLQQTTIEGYRQKLMWFVEFCKESDVTNLNQIDGRFLNEFVVWRATEGNGITGELAPKTLVDDVYLLRSLVTYLESINAVERGTSSLIRVPTIDNNEGVSDEYLEAERAEQIRRHLERYDYAGRDHVIWELWCETGRRISCLRALDLEDVEIENDEPRLRFLHRPGTKLKNRQESNSIIFIDDRVAQVLEDYISTKRIDIVDDEGRDPLLTTRHGRISTTTLRKISYEYTRPCEVTGECPHNRDINNCSAAQDRAKASKCPSSRSPHAIRHGFATACIEEGIPVTILSGRFDASSDVIREHYDETTLEEQARGRKDHFEKARDNGGGYL